MQRFITIMLIAGEPSGDSLGAEWVRAFGQLPEVRAMPWPPEFIGAGGPQMSAAGVRLEMDLTAHAVFGISDALKQYLKFRGFFGQLFRLALQRQPEVIVLIDFGGFNLRFAKAVKRYVRERRGPFNNWNPKIVYFVSPQVWASRQGRAYQLARDVDLLLSIFPFEKAWYAACAPRLHVEFVGHPLVDRHSNAAFGIRNAELQKRPSSAENREMAVADTPRLPGSPAHSLVLLLPGSRKRELEAHLPVMIEAARKIQSHRTIRVRMVLPNRELAQFAARWVELLPGLEVRTNEVAASLSEADLAIASSGTVTLECAFFRVPTVVLYKTSRLTYQIARRIITVKFIAMPNLLARELVFPELIQDDASAELVADAALDLLSDPSKAAAMKSKLSEVVTSLGEPGASRRAAEAVLNLLNPM